MKTAVTFIFVAAILQIAYVQSFGVETISFPTGCGVVNVTEAPFNADNTGATDATAAIQQALDINKAVVVIYFPDGTYKVSNTLTCATYATDADNHGPIIVGQNRKQTVIRLADGTFTDANNPRPVMITGDGVAQNFDKAVHNLTINVGSNNPGANGLYFYANNLGLLSDVDIISEDGQGVKGLDLGYGEQGPCGVQDIYVRGFQYGVHGGALNAVALSQITVEGQSVAGVYVLERYIWLDSLTSTNSVPAVINKWDVLLVDAHLKGGAAGTPAIRNESNGMVFLRGITTEGYGSALDGRAGTTIDEYSSRGYERLWSESPERSMNLPSKHPPEIAWETDPAKWAIATAYKGGLGVPQRTDQEALQAAIDDANKTVVFAKGRWALDDTLYIRGNIKRFVGGGADLSGGAVVITDECTEPMIGINWISNSPIINRSSKTVVLQSVHLQVYAQGTGELYITDIAQGVRVMNPAQKVWMWQFNAETGPMNEAGSAHDFSLRVDAGRARVFGWKDEGNGIATVMYGGVTEILGFLQYTAPDASHPTEMIIKDAAFSLALHSEICWNCGGGIGYSTLVQETRGGETRSFRDSDNGGSDNYGVFTAYRSSDLEFVNTDRPQTRIMTRRSAGDAIAVGNATGTIRLDFGTELNAATTVRLLNLRGQVVRSLPVVQGQRVVTLSGLRSGGYVVRITDNQGRVEETKVVAK